MGKRTKKAKQGQKTPDPLWPKIQTRPRSIYYDTDFWRIKDTKMTEGRKDDKEKPRMELISAIATLKKAQVYTFGANKYGENNWRAGLKWTRVLGALKRHITAFEQGEDLDPETSLSHMAHAACCVDFLLEYEDTHRDLDDRYRVLGRSFTK